jgi:hypothetical protein
VERTRSIEPMMARTSTRRKAPLDAQFGLN